MALCLHTIDTPLGALTAGASEHGICLLLFSDQAALLTIRSRVEAVHGVAFQNAPSPHFQVLENQVAAYFDGTRLAFDVPLHLTGTTFQQHVWTTLQGVAAGRTQSYGELARRLGQPDAVRAVAKANGDNPVLLLVPCHRIVGASGALTGYSGGLHRKQWLLAHEQRGSGFGQPSLFE